MLWPSLLFSNPRDNPSFTRYCYKILTLGPCFKLPFSLPNPSGNPSCTRYCYNNVTLGSCFELQIHCGIPSLTRPWDLAVRNDCSNQDALLKTVFSIKARALSLRGMLKSVFDSISTLGKGVTDRLTATTELDHQWPGQWWWPEV